MAYFDILIRPPMFRPFYESKCIFILKNKTNIEYIILQYQFINIIAFFHLYK